MKWSVWCLVLFCALFALPVQAAGIEDAGDQAETLILRKLAEDSAYFKWILSEKKAGRTGDLDAKTFEGEVRRAKGLEPVIDYIVDTARKKPNGERLDLPRIRSQAGGSYIQLATYLNVIGTIRSEDFLRAQQLAEQIDLEVGFGPTQSIEGYRVALTRHYYYLHAIALYHAHEDAKAVQWFGQIDSDTEVQAMNLTRKKEIESLRLADLSQRPIAVTAFANSKPSDDTDWIGLAVSDGVTNDLVRYTDLTVVERTRLQSIMEELSLGMMGVVDEKHAIEVGKQLEAGTLVYGSYIAEGDVVTMTGRLVHVESGAILQSAVVKTDDEHLFEGTRELTTQLLGDAGLMTAVEKMKIAGARAPQGSAVRAVAKARLMAASNPDGARELFEEAMANDPEYANAHETLRMQFADVAAKVAVMPLRNTTGKAEDAWLSDGLAELFGRDLPLLGFSTVERSEMRKVLTYQLALMGAEDAGGDVLEGGAVDLAAMGEQMAANFIVLGGFQRLNDDVKISIRFVDVGSGEVLYTAGADGPMSKYGEVVSEVVAELAGHVGRELDSDTMAQLVEGKPTLDEFERFMRSELAKDALTADEARAEGEKARLEEGSEDRERLEALVQERVAEANSKASLRRTIGATGVVAGASMAGVGLFVGHLDRQKAGEFIGLSEHSIRQEDADRYYEQSLEYHKRANTMQIIGASGIGLAVVSTAVMVIGGNGKPDLDGIELGEASASLHFDVTPTRGGAKAGVQLRF
ncbi:MAG: hypothetical protein KC912_24670 [Proteobacteria bacterium]|nr:hypothetical protein [Pseudomonadota bacterium]